MTDIHAAPVAASAAELPTPFNFADHIIHINAGRGGKAAFMDDAGTLSYAQLADGIRQCATGLQALGMRREERALLLMQDCNDWPVAFLGSLYAGVVPVAVNTMLTADDYAYMLANSRAQMAFVSASLLPALQAAMAKAPHELRALIVSGATASEADGQAFDSWLAKHTPLPAPANTSPDDMAFWLYSSGSTGRPKGTVHAQGSLYHTAELYGRHVLGLNDSDVTFSAAKLFFAYGLGNGLSFPLTVGATSVLMAERPTPSACFARLTGQVQGVKPTVFYGAPTGFAGMLAAPDLPGQAQTALRMCSSAGEALPRDLGERFSRHFGVEIVDGIGSTEMLHVYLSNRPGDVRYGTTGKPVAGYDIELRDEDGNVLQGNGEIGDLYINGPSSALFYWANRHKTRETFQGAWTKSGDKYMRDADGYYVYSGRGDDMLKISGQYVSPFEVESTLQQHGDVLEAAVIGVSDENGLTRAKAFVVLKDAARANDALAEELKTFVKSRLAPVKYPRQLVFLDELPKTATGKIQRFRLRDQEKMAG